MEGTIAPGGKVVDFPYRRRFHPSGKIPGMNSPEAEAEHLRKQLVDAACCVMEAHDKSEHAITGELPGGNRILIEIAILPPLESPAPAIPPAEWLAVAVDSPG
jgi:hypothetical protein